MKEILFRGRRFDSAVGLSSITFLSHWRCKFWAALSDAPHYLWQYFAFTNHTDPKKSEAKNDICAFCDKSFSGPRIVINKKDDDRALPECNGVTQWAPCPRRAGSQ